MTARTVMRVRGWLRSLFRRDVVEREMDDEIRTHLELACERLMARGMSAADARAEARREFGNVSVIQEEARDARGVLLIENVIRDVRYAFVTLRRTTVTSASAIITLGLAIGANTAVFAVVHGVLLRPLPYGEPDRLLTLGHSGETVAPATFLDWQAQSRSFAEMGLAEYWTPSYVASDTPEEVPALRVTGDFLSMLRVQPILGRRFVEQEAHAGKDHVVVLGFTFWQQRLAADSNIVGKTVVLSGERYAVVGVMPRGVRFVPVWSPNAQLAVPLVLDDRRTDRQGASLHAFARLRPGVTNGQMREDLAGISRRLAGQFPGTDQSIVATPLLDEVTGSVRRPLLVLLGAVICVLLIACANVAHLQLIRGARRDREYAIRTALGGTRWRLVQQSLVESGVLAISGGALGLALACGGVRILVALAPARLPRVDSVGIDPFVIAFTLCVTALATSLAGVAPALIASRRPMFDALRSGSRGAGESRRRRRLGSMLVVSEFAVALVLLVTSGLVIRSFIAMLAVDAGYDTHNVLSMKVSLSSIGPATAQRRTELFGELVRRVNAMPGVDTASVINHLPLHGDHWRFPFLVEGANPVRPRERVFASFRVAEPGYFRTLHIPLREGRDFNAADLASGARVVIVNEAMAGRRWPGASALGRRISVDDPSKGADWFRIVGVVKTVKQGSWTEDNAEEMYFPHIHGPAVPSTPPRLIDFLSPTYMTLVARSGRDAASLAAPVREVIRTLDTHIVVSDVLTMEQAVGEQFAPARFYLVLFGVFAGVAVALSVVGVYGVISYSVAARTREIGLRLALGAPVWSAFRVVVGEGMRLAGTGTVVGLVLAVALTRYLRSMLFAIQPTDTPTMAAVVVLLLTIGLVACSLPAWRAMRVDPMIALRSE